MAVRPKEFLEQMSAAFRFNVKSVMKASIERFQGHAMDAIITLIEHIASRPENIKSPFATVFPYVELCWHILFMDIKDPDGWLTPYFIKLAKLFELVFGMTVHTLQKQHLDESSQRVVEYFHGFLVDMLRASYLTKNMSEETVYQLTMGDVVRHRIMQGDLLVPLEDGATSAIGNTEIDDRIGASLMRLDVLEVALSACSLEFYNALMRSSSVDLRNRAAYQMGNIAWEIHLNKREFKADYHRLLEDYTAKFLLAKDIMGYLLGPQSHATLIGRTTVILAFMAATGTLTRRDADTIWAISFNFQQPDDAQSAMEVLKILPPYMSPFAKTYFCNKFRVLPLSQFTRDAEVLLQTLTTEFLRTSVDGQYEATRTCVSLLSKVEDSDVPPVKQNSLMVILGNMLLTIQSPRNAEETLRLIELCTTPIASLAENATGYVQALVCILRQKDFAVQPHELYGRLTFHKCVEELIVTLRRGKDGARLFVSQALWCRLELITHILQISSPSENTADSEKALCQHVFGEHASAPIPQNTAWRYFLQCFQANHPRLGAFNRRFINENLPQLSPGSATIETINFFRFQYARHESDEMVLLPLDEELIRFALAVPSEELAKGFTLLLMDRLFKGKAIKHPELATRHQISVVRRLAAQIAQQEASATRAAEMLLRTVIESNRFRTALEQSNDAVSGVVSQKKSETPQDSILIPVRIHKGNEQPQSKIVTINKSANRSELDAAIASETGFANYTVVSAGQKINFAEEPEQSISQLGLKEGNVLIVQKHSTFESIQDEVNKRAESSVIEEEIVSHLQVLYGILEESNRKAQFVLQTLEWLKFPGPIRAMIAAPETPFEQIFPSGSSLRLRASIEVLSIQLKEQVAHGVADEKFLLRGVHLLVELLYRTDTLQEVTDVSRTAETLLEMLRERPINDVTGEYFKEPTRFTHQILDYITRFSDETAPVDHNSVHHFTIRALYQCLLESVLLSPPVCSAFIAADAIVQIHTRLVLTGISYLRGTISRVIVNAILDERASPELKAFFSKLSLDQLIQAALEQPLTCDHAFFVSYEAISADRTLASDEELLRSSIDRFANTLLDLKHLERYGHGFVDKRVSGLVSLLRCCVQKLVTQNKALNLGDLASQLFKTLLFPMLKLDKILQPVIFPETRNSIYDLLQLMCEDAQTLEELSDNCDDAVSYCSSDQTFNFTGPNGYIRQEGNCAGLANLGQTCYFNSLLQQLFMNVQFRKFVFDTQVLDSKKQTVLAELKLAFASMQDSHDIFYQPDDLVKALNVDSSVQDDAHIFFMTLIGQLEESMPDDEAKNTLKSFFRGVNKSQTIGSCKHVSESTDEYLNLSLVVKDKASLEESLEEYTKGATLEGSDKFRCITCGSGEGVSVDAVQRTAFEHIPDNLVLGLRRFRYETYDGGQKVNDRFDFPERIDMSRYKLNRLAGVEGQSESDVFQLVGVVVHQGILTFGHYWSYAAERGRNDSAPLRWFRFEDKNVRISSIEEVLCETRGGLVPTLSTSLSRDQSPCLRSDNAYVLFYQRVSSISESTKCLASSTSMFPGGAPARVSLPQNIETRISKENEQKMLYLHLFSLRHVEFVRGLAGKVDTIKEPDADKSSKITYKLMSMLLRYYIRVVASLDNEFAPQSIEFTSSMLQKLACRGKDFAKWMLEAIISRTSEEGKSRSIALHYKRTVRLATNRLIMACFRHLREHDAKYVRVEDEDSVMVPTIQGLTRLQSLLLERAPSVWWEYFELLRHVAELGSEETHVLLHLGVLQWCFEVLFIKEDTVLQKKHPDIMRYLAQDSRSLNYPAIINCIYGLLHNFVDLSGPTAFDSSERQTGARMLLLTDEEYDYLLQQSRSGINWIVEHCMQGFERLKKMDWHEWPPSKLIVLLTNANRVSHKLYKDTVQTLIINIESTTDWDVISQSVALCLLERKMKSTTEEDVFQEIRRILNSYEARRLRHPEAANLLWIVTNVYGTHSPMLLPHMAAMTLSFLVCDDSEVEKDTRDWLRNSVLQQGVLSKPYTVDQVQGLRQKICSIRELLIGLGDQLIGPIYKNEASSLYEYSIDAYQDCGTYLSQVSSRLKPELEEWLKNEESDTEALTEFDTTVQELIDDTSKIHELLRNHGELRDRIREWQDERSSSDGPSNSHIYEIDDGEFWLLI
jgi:ubiquitin carboxyl-terminal hydrolase 34